MSDPIRLRIFYPSDPLGSLPGGIETFIRGVIGWAPEDVDVSVVGLTTDAAARPVGQWLDLTFRDRPFRHFATYAVGNPTRQPRVPATVRYLAALAWRRGVLDPKTYDIAEVHRLEPVMLVPQRVPINAVMHQDSQVLYEPGTDIRWRHLPALYFALESHLIRRTSSVFSVFQSAVEGLKGRYPGQAEQIRFTPTWFDPDTFSAPSPPVRGAARRALRTAYGWPQDARVLVLVGRLDTQKDPALALEALASLQATRAESTPPWRLLYVGDGALRPDLEARAEALGLGGAVRFAGLLTPLRIAQCLQGADVFLLPSRYEGMPIALLEALASGLPSVASDVGEVRRVLREGVNGYVISKAAREAGAFVAAIERVMADWQKMAGTPCADAVAAYTPQAVLSPIYDNYRALCRSAAAI